MFDCTNLLHPFQHDPGVSQRQRIMDDLLDGSVKIDGRKLADLLNYFVQLSRHINYYDKSLAIGDWQPFFQKSLPFSVAAMAGYDQDEVKSRFEMYGKLFDKRPSPQGLQLLLFYTYYGVIHKINTWYSQVKGSDLPVELAIAKLTRDRLREPINEFAGYAHCAVRWFCIRPLDFTKLRQNDIWDIRDPSGTLPCETDLFKSEHPTRWERLVAIKERIVGLFTAFMGVVEAVSDVASATMEDSLEPLKEEFRQNHPPHLALIFAFLKLFRYLQDDLNSYTRKHLNFFYKDVLKLAARDARPDHVHLVFEIQNALERHRLAKGLLARDGKDNNKEDILYSLDEEIVVNKAQVADQRTLFLNYETLGEKTYLEGVYMAPDATKADGVKKDFKESDPKSFATLGAKESKYLDPETKFIKPHPRARLGFILASPVLLLNEGQRTIRITLNCKLDPRCDDVTVSAGGSSPCCDDDANEPVEQPLYPEFADASNWYDEIVASINGTYYYFNRDLIAEAVKKGLDRKLADKLIRVFLTDSRKQCYCPVDVGKYESTIIGSEINASNEFNGDELGMINTFFPPRKAIRTWYSGAEEWLEPDSPSDVSISPAVLPGSGKFAITITSVFGAGRPAITFYDKDKLKEDFNTTLPLARIELDDTLKIWEDIRMEPGDCCLENKYREGHEVSLYHFFRDVTLSEENTSQIEVEVCGVRNLIVQNDESVQDVNSPILPFGVRPKVGASFYVGSKEVFSKNWQTLWLNVTWKDKPADLQQHYKYYDYEPYEDGTSLLTEASFKVRAALLETGVWKDNGERRLFKEPGSGTAPFCGHDPLLANQDVYRYLNTNFAGQSYVPMGLDMTELLPLSVNSRYGFLRMTLKGVSFQHERYAFVLARHMMVLAGLIDPASLVELRARIDEAVDLVDSVKDRIDNIDDAVADIIDLKVETLDLLDQVANLLEGVQDDLFPTPNIPDALDKVSDIVDTVGDVLTPGQLRINVNAIFSLAEQIKDWAALDFDGIPDTIDLIRDGLKQLVTRLIDVVDKINDIVNFDPNQIGLPKEPYTPAISAISLDYTALANVDDIKLIHVHPFSGTYHHQEIELQPALFPTFCDEGTLFLGLKNLKPGSNVHILFQLAEATADSEAERKEVNWFYLDSNQWKLLRKGFEVLDDATNGLTASGVIRFALPANMTADNTIMPRDLHWIKAAIPVNSRSVCETIGIHAQAIRATFTNEERNDKQRLAEPLPDGSISKLQVADAAVKKISQPYEGFAGRVPEASSHFYVRGSELLRHKGRAIQRFDYERLVLEEFPQVYRAKCINHSFGLNAHRYYNDFPLAPGYVIVAVIPDLTRLKAAQSFEPRVPVSMLEDIVKFLKSKTSPFVRLRAMNPRYEKVYFGLKVKFYPGKDEIFYKETLIRELREFLAPWAVGEYSKLAFGQCIYRSDIVSFLESRDYLDYIIELRMEHEREVLSRPATRRCPEDELSVCPLTPRSILIAGDIDLCVVQQDCETWGEGACDVRKVRIVDYCNE